jgi:hypothetical protein
MAATWLAGTWIARRIPDDRFWSTFVSVRTSALILWIGFLVHVHSCCKGRVCKVWFWVVGGVVLVWTCPLPWDFALVFIHRWWRSSFSTASCDVILPTAVRSGFC